MQSLLHIQIPHTVIYLPFTVHCLYYEPPNARIKYVSVAACQKRVYDHKMFGAQAIRCCHWPPKTQQQGNGRQIQLPPGDLASVHTARLPVKNYYHIHTLYNSSSNIKIARPAAPHCKDCYLIRTLTQNTQSKAYTQTRPCLHPFLTLAMLSTFLHIGHVARQTPTSVRHK